MSFMPKRITRKYRQTIHAAPDRIFPLLCPVREAEWLDGWDYRMIHSQCGLAEDGAVFATSLAGEEDTIWIVTLHDPVRHEVEFARFTPGSRTCTLRLEVSAIDGASSEVSVTYVYTGLTEAGNAYIERITEMEFLKVVRFWERSMNYWLRTGTKLVEAR